MTGTKRESVLAAREATAGPCRARRPVLGLVVAVLAACQSEAPSLDQPTEPATPVPYAPCEGPVAHRYDPIGATELLTFPDDAWMRADADSATGLRLRSDDLPWTASVPDVFSGIVDGLDGLDGFGRLGAVVLRFTAPIGEVPSGAADSVDSSSWRFVDLDAEPPTRVPFVAELSEGGRQVLLQPLVPLAAGARHAVVVTTAHQTPDGGCIAPAPVTRALVAGTPDAALDGVASAVRDLLPRLDLTPDEVSAVTTFTTHEAAAAAADIATVLRADARQAWVTRSAWTDSGDGWLRSDGVVRVLDARAGPDALVTWDLPLLALRPANTEGPLPVVLYGHGMNGSRSDARTLARHLAGQDVVIVAVDAMEHGDHPTAVDNTGIDALDFLGIDFQGPRLDMEALRDHFRQTPLDRMQVLDLLRRDGDIDGDGTDDVDAARVAYFGISLGGLLGPGLLALDGGIEAAALPVGGGLLTRFITDTGLVKPFLPLLDSIFPQEGGLVRIIAVGQAAVDAADPAVLGAHVLRDRLDEGLVPHLLFPASTDDEVVPPSTAQALARALQLPHVPAIVVDDPLLPTAAAPPLTGNVDGLTLGYLELDRVTEGDAVVPAGHESVWSKEGELLLTTWMDTWLHDDAPTIVDPYALLGTPPRVE